MYNWITLWEHLQLIQYCKSTTFQCLKKKAAMEALVLCEASGRHCSLSGSREEAGFLLIFSSVTVSNNTHCKDSLRKDCFKQQLMSDGNSALHAKMSPCGGKSGPCLQAHQPGRQLACICKPQRTETPWLLLLWLLTCQELHSQANLLWYKISGLLLENKRRYKLHASQQQCV